MASKKTAVQKKRADGSLGIEAVPTARYGVLINLSCLAHDELGAVGNIDAGRQVHRGGSGLCVYAGHESTGNVVDAHCGSLFGIDHDCALSAIDIGSLSIIVNGAHG